MAGSYGAEYSRVEQTPCHVISCHVFKTSVLQTSLAMNIGFT